MTLSCFLLMVFTEYTLADYHIEPENDGLEDAVSSKTIGEFFRFQPLVFQG